MKSKLLLAIATLVIMACSSDDVKELITTTQDFTATESFTVSVPAGENLTFSQSKSIDASLSGFDIKEVELVSITGSINNVIAPNQSNLTAASLTLEGTGITLELGNTPLATGTSVNFTIENIPDAQIDIIESYILLNNEININASATVDSAPVDFKLDIEFKIKATVTPS